MIDKPSLNEIEDFSKKIEEIIKTDKIDVISATAHYCDINGIDYEIAKNLLSHKLLSMIYEEAVDRHLIAKKYVTTKLDI